MYPEKTQEILKKLDQMVGLQTVKEEIRKQMDLVAFNRKLISEGMPAGNICLNLVFQGAPGTGKTTVARLVGELYHSLGVLRKGHIVETTGRDLIAGYVGQSTLKTEHYIKEALGGILFIDDAGSILDYAEFGSDVINALVQGMEDHRDDLVVIVAGYPDEIAKLMHSNKGLRTHLFPTVVEFAPFTLEELLQILDILCSNGGYELSLDAREAAGKKLAAEMKEFCFGNGRAVRRLFFEMENNLAMRCAQTNNIAPIFLACDVPNS